MDKIMEVNEMKVQSLLSVFFAPVNGSCFNDVYGEVTVGEPTQMMNRKINRESVQILFNQVPVGEGESPNQQSKSCSIKSLWE